MGISSNTKKVNFYEQTHYPSQVKKYFIEIELKKVEKENDRKSKTPQAPTSR